MRRRLLWRLAKRAARRVIMLEKNIPPARQPSSRHSAWRSGRHSQGEVSVRAHDENVNASDGKIEDCSASGAGVTNMRSKPNSDVSTIDDSFKLDLCELPPALGHAWELPLSP